MREEELYWLWLAQVLGPAPARGGELLAAYKTPWQIYEARQQEDFSFYLTSIQAARLHTLELEAGLPLQARCRQVGARLLCYGGAGYPRRFLDLPDPPVVLYATGRPEVLEKGPVVGLVGSRRPSAYGTRAAQALADVLAGAGVVLVSGLADGLDSEAHRAAVRAGSPTVGFLGCAIDRTYPAANRALRAKIEENGEVLSEYAPGEGGRAACFLQRNRLIAASCDLLCVVEARAQSGTISTVNHAQRYGRPVYAVPGDIFSPQSAGVNELLAQGRARPVTGPDTLLKALGLTDTGPGAPQVPQIARDEGETRLLQALAGGPQTLSQLCAVLQAQPGPVLAGLTGLEMKGLVGMAAGAYSLR